MAGMWQIKKEREAREIMEEAQRLNVREMIEPMISMKRDGSIGITGEDLPGGEYADVPAEELEKSATLGADPELWWCRTIAKRRGLGVGFMDWYWYSHIMEVADDAICSKENTQVCGNEEVLGN